MLLGEMHIFLLIHPVLMDLVALVVHLALAVLPNIMDLPTPVKNPLLMNFERASRKISLITWTLKQTNNGKSGNVILW